MASRRNRQQIRIDRALDDVAHARLPDEHLRQPALVRQPQWTMHARTAHVGVDDQHARASVRQRHRDVAGRRGFAFERLRAGDDEDLRPFGREARHDRRPQRAERLAEVVRDVRRGEHWMLVVADRRHEAEKRQLQTPRDVFRRLDGVVHVVEPERDGDRQPEPDGKRGDPRPASRRRERRLRNFGAVDHLDVVRAAVTRDAQLFLALQQRFIDGAVALRLALHHVVTHALATQILGVGFGRFEVVRVRAFREQRGIVLVLDCLKRFLRFDAELALCFRNLRVERDHRRVFVAVLLRGLRLRLLQLREFRLELLDWRVLNRDRQGVGRHDRTWHEKRLDLVVLRLFLHALELRLRVGVVQLVETRTDDVLLVVERHRVLFVAVLRQRAPALFHLGLLIREPLPSHWSMFSVAPSFDSRFWSIFFHQRVGALRRKRRIF